MHFCGSSFLLGLAAARIVHADRQSDLFYVVRKSTWREGVTEGPLCKCAWVLLECVIGQNDSFRQRAMVLGVYVPCGDRRITKNKDRTGMREKSEERAQAYDRREARSEQDATRDCQMVEHCESLL